MSTAQYFNLFDDDDETNLVPFFNVATTQEFSPAQLVEPDSVETELISGLFTK